MNYLDKNGLKQILDAIKKWLNKKVDKELGKGLSTNDFSTAEMEKLQGIEAQAQVNKINHIIHNDVELMPDEQQKCYIETPTKISQLNNDVEYVTKNFVTEQNSQLHKTIQEENQLKFF